MSNHPDMSNHPSKNVGEDKEANAIMEKLARMKTLVSENPDGKGSTPESKKNTDDLFFAVADFFYSIRKSIDKSAPARRDNGKYDQDSDSAIMAEIMYVDKSGNHLDFVEEFKKRLSFGLGDLFVTCIDVTMSACVSNEHSLISSQTMSFFTFLKASVMHDRFARAIDGGYMSGNITNHSYIIGINDTLCWLLGHRTGFDRVDLISLGVDRFLSEKEEKGIKA